MQAGIQALPNSGFSSVVRMDRGAGLNFVFSAKYCRARPLVEV
jgi:hypothetical protein